MAKAPKKAVEAGAQPVPMPQDEFKGAGDGAGGEAPASATEAGGDAVQDPIAPAVTDGHLAPEATAPVASEAAGTNAPADSPAAHDGRVAIVAHRNLHVDGEAIAEGQTAEIRAELVEGLLAIGAVTLVEDMA